MKRVGSKRSIFSSDICSAESKDEYIPLTRGNPEKPLGSPVTDGTVEVVRIAHQVQRCHGMQGMAETQDALNNVQARKRRGSINFLPKVIQ